MFKKIIGGKVTVCQSDRGDIFFKYRTGFEAAAEPADEDADWEEKEGEDILPPEIKTLLETEQDDCSQAQADSNLDEKTESAGSEKSDTIDIDSVNT